jgi:hypothetical protein
VEVLRGHGGTIKRVEARDEDQRQLLSSAVQAGALPNLTYFNFHLEDPIHREILSGDRLPLLEEVEVLIMQDDGEHVAAFEPLRRLPHLRRLSLTCVGPQEAAFHSFIPPSLKALRLSIDDLPSLESLLRELPAMLQASGASLQEIELWLVGELDASCGATLAQVLRTCSSTLDIEADG